ncbi:MAG: NADH-quinone oxidoreductase subunit L, partial [Acidobacteriales bacterium]|nr:NADH-quinone oxidoreductase subunit L [Terriglobales bacterium]
TASLGWLYRLVLDKYRIDELYAAVIVRPVVIGSEKLLWKGCDAGFIDGIVNGLGSKARSIGGVLRLAQSGYIRSYAVWVVLGALLILLVVSSGGGAR